MAPPLENLTGVLTELAARLSQPPAGGGVASSGDTLSASISALNPNGDVGGASSGTSVLDAALSLMCFDPLEVNSARVDCLVRTLVSALSASVSCRVVRADGDAGEEMLCVGLLGAPCRPWIATSWSNRVQPLWRNWGTVMCYPLSPHYQCLFPLPYYKEDGEGVYDMGTISAELINHPSNCVFPGDHSIPLRLLLWHLDPSIIRHDLSGML